MPRYVRFQSATPNRLGLYPGVFALAHGLAGEGLPTAADRQLWRQANDRMHASYAHPTDTDPHCYDSDKHPGAVAWFRLEGGGHLIELTGFYLDLLDRYDISWVELRTSAPGRIHYEDCVQVVTTPWAYPEDWPFS